MSSLNLSTSLGDNGDTEMSSCDQVSTSSEDVSHNETPSQPLDLRVATKRDVDELTLPPPNFHRQAFPFFNAPRSKNVTMPTAEIKPFGTMSSTPEDLSSTKSLQLVKLPTASSDQPADIVAADSSIQESKTKLTLKFWLKKCGEISLYFRSSSRKVVAPTNSRFQSLLTSLKNTVKNLAKAMPVNNVVGRLRNSVLDKINGRRMQDYVKLLNLTFKPFSHQKLKGSANVVTLPALPSSQRGPDEATFLNPLKKPELQHLAGFQFAKPKFYECTHCDTRFYKLPIYIRHIRRHSEIIRCDTCWKAFSSVINKRRHQLQCRQRPMP